MQERRLKNKLFAQIRAFFIKKRQKSPDIASGQFLVFECFSSFVFLCSYDLNFENQFNFPSAKLRLILI